ncbi:MAG: LPXTG cell wall anchor domain-containing protein [Oscillospiraceae bacterium]|nr:LPXTG cell wall anchor domain-containing protein [Oscillospiraceae bacterium]
MNPKTGSGSPKALFGFMGFTALLIGVGFAVKGKRHS